MNRDFALQSYLLETTFQQKLLAGAKDGALVVDDKSKLAGLDDSAIKAAALNFFDILMIQGKYQIKPPFPFSPAAEVAGVIESVGAGVTDLKVGERVVTEGALLLNSEAAADAQ